VVCSGWYEALQITSICHDSALALPTGLYALTDSIAPKQRYSLMVLATY